jgi:hypothetical protein
MRWAQRTNFESGGCPARRSLFFACPKKRDEKKGPPKTCPLPLARGSLRFSRRAALTKLPRYARSDNARLSPPDAAMLGGVNGRVAHRSGYGVPPSPWCSRAPQAENGSARGLSDRPKGAINKAGALLSPLAAPAGRGPWMARDNSAAPVFCRGAQGSRSVAQTKPWGAVFFAFFLLGKQKKEGLAR